MRGDKPSEEVAQLRGAVQAGQDELTTAKSELAAMNERLASAEAIAKRLQEERADLQRREAALRQQEAAISEETVAMAQQTEELTRQLEVLRAERARLEVKQKELEEEWDTARTRVTPVDHFMRRLVDNFLGLEKNGSVAALLKKVGDTKLAKVLQQKHASKPVPQAESVEALTEAFRDVFHERIAPSLVPELSDEFRHWYLTDRYLAIALADTGKLLRAWERASATNRSQSHPT